MINRETQQQKKDTDKKYESEDKQNVTLEIEKNDQRYKLNLPTSSPQKLAFYSKFIKTNISSKQENGKHGYSVVPRHHEKISDLNFSFIKVSC